MKTQDTVLIALFAALIVVLSLMPPIPLPAIPVPVTLQTLGTMLAGAMLGPVRGGLACLLYLRSEEHTSELQSLMRTSYAVFCLKKKKKTITNNPHYSMLSQ